MAYMKRELGGFIVEFNIPCPFDDTDKNYYITITDGQNVFSLKTEYPEEVIKVLINHLDACWMAGFNDGISK